MLRFASLVLLALAATGAWAAPSYTVTNGPLVTTYANISGGTAISLSSGQLSSAISPAGFSFTYFGTAYTNFKVGSSGYVILGSAGTTTSTTAAHGTAPGLVVAPLWCNLKPGAGMNMAAETGTVRWAFASGVLSVEWRNCPLATDSSRGVRMQVQLDTFTGNIEFRYGSPQGGSGATASAPYSCAISGPTGGTQEIIAGAYSGYVKSDGVVTAYPSGQFIRFSPAPASVPADIEVRETDSTGTVIANGASAAGGRAFGSRDIAAGASTALTIFVTNTGGSTLNVQQPSLTGADASQFVLNAGGFPAALAGGQSITFTVAFDPGTAGAKSATVSFGHDDSSTTTPYTFEITGTGTATPLLGVSDAGGSIAYGASSAGTGRDFGSQLIAAGTTTALTITVQNSGSGDLTLGTPTLTGTDAGEFVLGVSSFATTVLPGGNTTFTVAFDPATVGTKTANVSFTHSDISVTNPFVFEVAGIGTQPLVPQLEVRETGASGTLITYGAGAGGIRDVGSHDLASLPSAAITIFVRNAGTADLSVGSVQSLTTDFTVSAGSFPATLTPGQSATFTITFAATTSGIKNGWISFTHNDTSVTTPFNFAVRGTAAAQGGQVPQTPALGGGGGGGGCAAESVGSGSAAAMLLLSLVVARRRRKSCSRK
ncbi:MAG: choice-of-anchor D domain-containing protein [Planctomycetes bacterium]|nr:choice-of-anchor D domain-containing protein [Planctomycetota bacterium]